MEELEFEKAVSVLRSKIEELRKLSQTSDLSLDHEIASMEEKARQTLKNIYSNLTPWQKVQIARHERRPHGLDYIHALFKDIFWLDGDRINGADQAIQMGIAKFEERTVLFIAQEKGHDIETRVKHNFGMTKPAGYRKAMRGFELADQLGLPVVCLIDTSGAYAGLEAEQDGQSAAISACIARAFTVRAPIVSVIIGEGGSGGAIALGVSNTVLMLEYAICAIASPETCSAILWKNAEHREEAASALKLTAEDLLETGYVDEIIDEPIGGAHQYPEEVIENVRAALNRWLAVVCELDQDTLVKAREEKFSKFSNV